MLHFVLGLAKAIASLTGLQAKRRLTWTHVRGVLLYRMLETYKLATQRSNLIDVQLQISNHVIS